MAGSVRPVPVRFLLTLIPGVLASLAFLFLVKDPSHSPNPELRFFSSLRGLPARFGDFSHSLLILAATQLLSPSCGVVRAAQVAGLCYVGRNVVQVMASYPIGILTDRFSALSVLVGG
jgi:hypothetical protein